MQADESHARQIVEHLERHLGPVQQIWRNADGPASRIDVAHIAASETRPVHTLITIGMSSVAMHVPAGVDAPQRLELMMTLPSEWRLDEEAMREEEWTWPVGELRRVARRPSETDSWLGWGHVVANGDPPRPYASNTRLCGVVIVPSLHVPLSFYELSTQAGGIAFFAAVPLYKEEMELAQNKSAQFLFEKLLDHEVRDLVDLKRRNVAKKRFGLF